MGRGSGTSRSGRRRTDVSLASQHPGAWRSYTSYTDALSPEQRAILNDRLPGEQGINIIEARIEQARSRVNRGEARWGDEALASLPTPREFMNEDDKRYLNNLGGYYNIDTYTALQVATSPIGQKIDFVAYYDDVVRAMKDSSGLSGPVVARINAAGNGRVNVSISFRGIELVRTFRKRGNGIAVHHALFTIPKNLQDKGISKAVFRELYKHYRSGGVDYIDVFANIDVGGYTWARYGFSAVSQYEVNSVIDHGFRRNNQPSSGDFAGIDITDGRDRAREIVRNYYTTHATQDPFPMNQLTGYSWSKQLLAGTSWDGFIDLKDPVQRKVFEDYLYKDKK